MWLIISDNDNCYLSKSTIWIHIVYSKKYFIIFLSVFRDSRRHKNFGRWAFGIPESTKSLDDGLSGFPKVQNLRTMGFRDSRKCKIFGRWVFGIPESAKSLDDEPSGFPKVQNLWTMGLSGFPKVQKLWAMGFRGSRKWVKLWTKDLKY